MLININPNDRPLCPNSGDDPKHQFQNLLFDEAYKVAEKDENSDYVNAETAKIMIALAYGRYSNRMNLYRESVVTPRDRIIQSWYFKCDTCNLILPAIAVKD